VSFIDKFGDFSGVRTSELQYDLPPELIAQQPADRRDASRLLVLDRATGAPRHEVFAHLPALLPPRCLLVLNDTRVLPARLYMTRRSGGQVEGLFLRQIEAGPWEIMLTGSGRLKVGEELEIQGPDDPGLTVAAGVPAGRRPTRRSAATSEAGRSATERSASTGEPERCSSRRLRLLKRIGAGTWHAEPNPPAQVMEVLSECGHPPLPPYIHRHKGRPGHDSNREDQEPADRQRYQTIYARSPGAVAAPTAGLHFTPEVFKDLETAGIDTAFVTLHVGVGTFAPIRCEDLADHNMHAEWYECPAVTAEAINAAREQGRQIVAVGTTSVRVLETCTDDNGRIAAGNGWTRLFIYPPCRFKAVDAMVTNFHLPGSTLLAMLFAFAGKETILKAYQEAIHERYRFYSYGDAMLIL
jgi:S-adenosylmethionine:tRNA ribosyltransferase-isomerase